MYVYNEELGIMEYEEVTLQDTESALPSEDVFINGADTESFEDDVLLSGDMVDNIVALDSSAVVPLAVNGLVTDVSDVLVYKGNITGYGECYLVFSASYEDSLTLLDGQLLNFSGSNITGAIYLSDNLNVQAVDSLLITVLGRASTQYASNYYRYGGESYVTSYTRNNTSTSLTSTSTYVQVSDVEQITYSHNYWFMGFMLIVFGILAYNGLRRMLNI